MAHHPNQWATRHGLYAQDGTYRSLPTTAIASLPILRRNDFPEVHNPRFVWGYTTVSGHSCWYVGHDWAFVYHRGNTFNPLYRLFHIRYGSQLARLYGLTRWFYEGEVFTERSFGIRNEVDLFFRVLGIVNPLFNANELDWDTFDLHTAETIHDHKYWHEIYDWDYYKDKDEDGARARSNCSPLHHRSTQAQRCRPCRRHSFSY
ncbi:hypothetical protein VMCG_00140 [Cytospora schulzeri]|uniref:Uncharacterized protein n=1 Tax=Cytospora schulzeri TaxID=448051 RepID=A0A423X8Z2_9PEZI|nr:hypothetical protein VMCG_00140 [Valsa malicola]